MNSQKTLQQMADYSSDKVAPNSMDIRTEYLEPITSNPLKYTFRLDQAGYLDTNSLIVFKLAARSAQLSNLLRVNQFNGVLGGVKRAIFQVGDHVINDVQDLNKYATIKTILASNKSLSNQYLGHYMGNQLWSKVVTGAGDSSIEHTSNQTYAQMFNTVRGSLCPDVDKSGISPGRFTNGTGNEIMSGQINQDSTVNNQYGITLGTLFPALQGQKIPLFLFDKQRILITVEFHPSSVWINNMIGTNTNYANGTNDGIASDGDALLVDVRMVVDYIIMPTEVQNKVIAQTQQQGGYKLNFFDVVSVEKNIPEFVGEQEVQHRIGQNNREVHAIYMWKEPPLSSFIHDGANNDSGLVLRCSQYCMGYSQEEFNVEVNGRDEFDHFVYNPCSQYNELAECLGSDPNLDRPEYINDEMTCGSFLSTMESGYMGTMKPLAYSLRNGNPGVVGAGRTIGNYPIIWKYKRTGYNATVANSLRNDHTIKVNYFIECTRQASITNTPKGMDVLVSY